MRLPDLLPPLLTQRRAITLTAAGLMVIFGTLFLWHSLNAAPPPAPQMPPLPVTAIEVKPQAVPASLDAVGTLTAVREVMLSPEVAGRVSRIAFDAGTEVQAGALLVQLFDGPELADRQAAKARASFAAVQLARSQRLAPLGAEPRETLQQNQSAYDQAVAAILQLDARLVQKQVRAPFTGEIGIRRINPGQYLNPGDAIATLTALDSLYVEFALPQQDLAQLRPGAQVDVSSDAYPGRHFTAQVNAVDPRIDEGTRNVTIQALLPNPGHLLRPGMYVTASLVLAPIDGALVVPTTAIQTSAQGDSVVVVQGPDSRKGGTAAIVPVQTGRRFGNNIIISRGLKPGDVVVSEGQLRLQPGAQVQVTHLVKAH